MPKRSGHHQQTEERQEERVTTPVRSFWTGTLTFGLVSIPVEFYAAVRPRQKSMKLVDKEGHALGRRYHCAADGQQLSSSELVRGYETNEGEMVIISDDEFESVAPEMSRDIDLRMFVPKDQIPVMYYQKQYFLAPPAGKSVKAYHVLAKIMERKGRVGIGAFVMRGQEYIVAIVAEDGVLRAETLRYADEIRTPEYVELPKRAAVPAKRVSALTQEIDALTENALDMRDFEDLQAQALRELAQAKQKRGKGVVHQADLEEEDSDYEGGAKVIDLMEVLRKSLAKNAVVTTARSGTRSRARRGQRAREHRKAG